MTRAKLDIGWVICHTPISNWDDETMMFRQERLVRYDLFAARRVIDPTPENGYHSGVDGDPDRTVGNAEFSRLRLEVKWGDPMESSGLICQGGAVR